MKVLHIIDTNGIGGAQSLLRGIIDHPCDTEHRVFVLRRHHGELLRTSERIEVFPSRSKLTLGPRKRLLSLISANKFDILHCHLPRSELFGSLVRRAQANRPVLIAHEHGQILGSDDHGFFTDLAYGRLKRLLKNNFAHHIAVSHEAKNSLVSRLGISNDLITIIPSFFDTTEFNTKIRLNRRSASRKADEIREEEFVVGYAGRIIAKKGWQVFLNALDIINKSGQKLKAVVAGDGPERPQFEQAVRSFGLTERIIDLKWVDDIKDFYSKLDCFVAPSYAEGSPVAAREAMAMGLPIIASTASGFRDLIDDGESGLLFEIGNAEHLAQKITQLTQSRDLTESLARGAIACAENFSVSEYLHALDDVYRNALRQ